MSETPLLTDARIILVTKDHLRALCSVKVAGSIVLAGLRVVEGERGLFVAMPARKDNEGKYADIYFPTSRAVREQLEQFVLETYHAAVKKAEQS